MWLHSPTDWRDHPTIFSYATNGSAETKIEVSIIDSSNEGRKAKKGTQEDEYT